MLNKVDTKTAKSMLSMTAGQMLNKQQKTMKLPKDKKAFCGKLCMPR